MDYKKYYKEVNAQKQINKIVKKYKNKKIIIYGAGIMANILFKNYDLSKLNIIAICDKKFETAEDKTFLGYKGISPKELKTLEADVIFVLLLQEVEVIEHLQDFVLMNTVNETTPVEPLIRIPFLKCLKILLG